MNISKHNLYGYLILILRVQSPWHFGETYCCNYPKYFFYFNFS